MVLEHYLLVLVDGVEHLLLVLVDGVEHLLGQVDECALASGVGL